MDMNFDLQAYLDNMRREQREDHTTLVEKVDVGFTAATTAVAAVANALAEHKLEDAARLTTLEGAHAAGRWFVRAVIGALVVGGCGVLWDMIVNHGV